EQKFDVSNGNAMATEESCQGFQSAVGFNASRFRRFLAQPRLLLPEPLLGISETLPSKLESIPRCRRRNRLVVQRRFAETKRFAAGGAEPVYPLEVLEPIISADGSVDPEFVFQNSRGHGA